MRSGGNDRAGRDVFGVGVAGVHVEAVLEPGQSGTGFNIGGLFDGCAESNADFVCTGRILEILALYP